MQVCWEESGCIRVAMNATFGQYIADFGEFMPDKMQNVEVHSFGYDPIDNLA